jgi:hypothetical protein
MGKGNSYLVLMLLNVLMQFGQKGTLVVNVHPVFNNKDLILSSETYVTANGDSVHIDVFKFYLSGICLHGKNSFCEKESYHLINAEEQNTLSFTIKNVPNGNYASLSFCIGVDSLKNTQGVQTGDLDPIKGMYWAWNTGYVAAKLEGNSKTCKTLHNAFEFHIGGYLPPYSLLRRGNVPTNLKIDSNLTVLDLYADVAEWFRSPENIDLSKTNSIVIPNKNALMIADNYADMIRIKK